MFKRFLCFMIVLQLMLLTSALIAGNKETADDLYRQGVEFVDKGQFIRAIAKLEQALELNADWKYLEPLAQAYEAQNDVDKAYETYDKLVKKAGAKLSAARRAEIKKTMDVLKVRRNQQASQAEAKAHYQVGTRLQQEGKLELAIIEFETAYDLSGEYFIKRNIAVIELALGNKARALSEFQKYLKYGAGQVTDRDRATVDAQIRQIQSDLKAEESLGAARSDIKKAREQIARGEHETAYKALEKSYKIYQFYDTLQYMGQASQGMKNYRRAIYFYNGFLTMGGNRIPPANAETVRSEIAKIMPLAQDEERRDQAARMAEQGRVYLENKDYVSALASFEQAYRFSQNYVYLEFIGEACEGLTHDGKALAAYEKFISDGGTDISTPKRDSVKRRIAALKLRQEDSNADEVGKNLFNLGMNAYNSKKYKQAALHFEAAYNKSPQYTFLNWYAESEAALKNYEKSVGLYQLYIDEGAGRMSPASKSKAEKRIAQLKQKLKTDVDIAAVPRDMEDELSDLISLEAGKDNEILVNRPQDNQPSAAAPVIGAPPPMNDGALTKEPEGPKKKRVWTWVALGVGIAGTAAAITTGVIAADEQDKLDAACPDQVCPADPEVLDAAMQKEQDIHSLTIARNISIGIGAAGMVAFVVLVILEPKYWAKKELAIAPILGTDVAGVSLGYSF